MVQERRALLMDLLRKFFAEKGYREVASAGDLDLVFENEGRRIGVKLIFYSTNPVKDQKIMRSYIYRFLRDKPCDEVYFAVEEVRYSHVPRAEEFKESGVGLLKLHEGRVEIAVPAVPLDRGKAAQASGNYTPFRESGNIVSKVSLAEDALIKELERRMEELVEQKLEKYLSRGAIQDWATSRVEASQQVLAPQQEPHVGSHGGFSPAVNNALPDVEFLKGNPWLEALMRRGRE